jgi:hypothetical protein
MWMAKKGKSIAERLAERDKIFAQLEASAPEETRMIKARNEKRQSALELKSYDGIAGLPPKWVSAPVLEQFRRIRDTLLVQLGHTHKEAIELLDRYPSVATVRDNFSGTYISPSGKRVDTGRLIDAVNYLGDLYYCCLLGPIEGLQKLAGKDARLGYQRRNQLKEFGKKQGADKHEVRAREWEKWREERDRIVENNPRLINKSEIARRIKKNLDLTDAVRTIRSKI